MSGAEQPREIAADTVFVVDDEPAVRKAVRLMLLSAGHKVETFSSAQEVLDALTTKRPGCLVSDVRMPGMDGMDLLKLLSERDEKLPIVMLTAHGDVSMAVDAMKSGAVEFLEKPADPEDLRRKVADALAASLGAKSDDEEREEVRRLLATLTPREGEVLRLLIDGKDARRISQILGSSHNTVRVQRSSIMKKMRADNIADLINMTNSVGFSEGD